MTIGICKKLVLFVFLVFIFFNHIATEGLSGDLGNVKIEKSDEIFRLHVSMGEAITEYTVTREQGKLEAAFFSNQMPGVVKKIDPKVYEEICLELEKIAQVNENFQSCIRQYLSVSAVCPNHKKQDSLICLNSGSSSSHKLIQFTNALAQVIAP